MSLRLLSDTAIETLIEDNQKTHEALRLLDQQRDGYADHQSTKCLKLAYNQERARRALVRSMIRMARELEDRALLRYLDNHR